MAAGTYENISEVTQVVNGASGLSDSTKAALTDLLQGMDPKAVGQISESLTNDNLATAAAGMGVLFMQPGATISANIPADSPIKGIILAQGDNTVSFATKDNVTVSIGGGSNDVTTGVGDDFIGLAGGNATIDTGAGDDIVSISGGNANITAGAGDLKVMIESGATGSATIDAGSGFDLVQVEGGASAHTFGYDAATGQFTMNSDFSLKMTDINVVTFGNADADGTVDNPYTSATLLAANPAQSMIGKLYQVALDRDNGGMDAASSADGQLGGINFWLDNTGPCITQQLVYSFLNCPEFHAKYDNLSDQDYVETLFANMGLSANDTVGGMTVADYVNTIATNTTQFGGRYDVAWALAASQEAESFVGNDGQKYVIDAGDLDMGNPFA